MLKGTKLTKAKLANDLGVSLSSLYYKHKRPQIDLEVKSQIEAVLTGNPSYGHKRIALALKLNKKRILRVMKKFNLKPYKRRSKKLVKKDDLNKLATKHQNLIKFFCPIRPNVVWVSDFTYIKYQNKFIYLATVMDLYTREIIGVNISRFHNKELILGALQNALINHSPCIYLHSDQGSEYDSDAYEAFCKSLGIQISMSKKGSPWENGFQESFYSQFKLDLGDIDQFSSIPELVEGIYTTLWYYNNKRIHTSLKMSPKDFRNKH